MATALLFLASIALSTATLLAQDPPGSVAMTVRVRGVSIFDVPGPPQGDFWDPVMTNVFGLFAGRAGMYPDVVVCARPPRTGAIRTCALVCPDVQNATGRGTPDQPVCRQSLALNLPAGDPRMLVDVVEVNDEGQQPRVIARDLRVADPTKCPEAQPCRFEISQGKGPLVLGFSSETAGRLAVPLPRTPTPVSPTAARCQPSSTWTTADLTPKPSGLHGPYASVDEAVLQDYASRHAYHETRKNPNEVEYGFLIVRDVRQPTGGYYTTPPAAAAPKTKTTERPRFTMDDYNASYDAAFSTCDYVRYFNAVATVHTHPNAFYLSDSFSADDFNQAIQFKKKYPFWEKIVMINAYDGQIRTFTPRASDTEIGTLLRSPYMFLVGMLPYVDVNWSLYAFRVEVIAEFTQ